MYTKFHQLTVEKQAEILNAAIKEFAEKGFENASTNEIIKSAKISKGSLFYYFHRKKDLYQYLIDYSMEIVEQVIAKIDFEEKDIFKRIDKIALEKLKIQRKNPQVFDFLVSIQQEEAREVKEVIHEKVDHMYEKSYAEMYQQIDFSLFREGIDVEKAMAILHWTLVGFGEKSIQQLDTFDELESLGKTYIKEWKQYSDLLKESFYKENEFHNDNKPS